MAIEIERKFLVFPELLPPLTNGEEIIQGYISTNPHLRYRLLGKRIVLNLKKFLPDNSRFELETEKNDSSIDEQQALLAMSIYPAIEKTRYRISFKELIWELDVYRGENSGLITVDVELPTLNYTISFPEWVNKSAEITEDSQYFNLNLGKFPFTKWHI